MPGRISFRPLSGAEAQLANQDAAVRASLAAIYAQIPAGSFQPYNMGGEQGAQTVVTARGQQVPFYTSGNMHSEMVALQWMLEQGLWMDYYGKIVRSDGSAVPANEYRTQTPSGGSLPHCGYCTITLQLLGLPLTIPSKGNYNYAVNANYPLPPQLKYEPIVLGRYWQDGSFAWNLLKQTLNNLINNAPNTWALQVNQDLVVGDNGPVDPANYTVIDWSVFTGSNAPWIDAVRAQTWKSLYNLNR